MKLERIANKRLFAAILGLSVTGFGCSAESGDPGGGGGSTSSGGSGSGGTTSAGGLTSSGGQITTTGGASSGGASTNGGATAKGGATGTGGAGSGGTVGSGGATAKGGATGKGGAGGADAGKGGGAATGGAASGGAPSGGSGGGSSGTCTASKGTGKSVTGTGPHKVVIETNSSAGIKCGTIYRPETLTGTEKFPIYLWGEGGCSQDGYSNQAAMGEIASWGYFVIADGTPGQANACQGRQNGAAFIEYLDWVIAENGKSCSQYYQKLETTKIAGDGFSCGGLIAENASKDKRFTAIGITSSGLMGGGAGVYDAIHTPFKIMNGGTGDVAYQNGLNDYDQIAKRNIPIIYFSKNGAPHGGDLSRGRGDFNLVNLAWLNWQLKGDTGATGKGFLIGSTCKFCMDSGWVFKSANVQ